MAREGLMDDSGYDFNECDGNCEECDFEDCINREEDCTDEWNKYYYDTRGV